MTVAKRKKATTKTSTTTTAATTSRQRRKTEENGHRSSHGGAGGRIMEAEKEEEGEEEERREQQQQYHRREGSLSRGRRRRGGGGLTGGRSVPFASDDDRRSHLHHRSERKRTMTATTCARPTTTSWIVAEIGRGGGFSFGSTTMLLCLIGLLLGTTPPSVLATMEAAASPSWGNDPSTRVVGRGGGSLRRRVIRGARRGSPMTTADDHNGERRLLRSRTHLLDPDLNGGEVVVDGVEDYSSPSIGGTIAGGKKGYDAFSVISGRARTHKKEEEEEEDWGEQQLLRQVEPDDSFLASDADVSVVVLGGEEEPPTTTFVTTRGPAITGDTAAAALSGNTQGGGGLGTYVSLNDDGTILSSVAGGLGSWNGGDNNNTTKNGVILVHKWDEKRSKYKPMRFVVDGSILSTVTGRSVSLSGDGQLLVVGRVVPDGDGSASTEEQLEGGEGVGVSASGGAGVTVYKYSQSVPYWTPMSLESLPVGGEDESSVPTPPASPLMGGWDVSMNTNGTRFAVSNPAYKNGNEDDDTNNKNGRGDGRVVVYQWNDDDKQWQVLGEPIIMVASTDETTTAADADADGETTSSLYQFGYSVSMSGDGSWLAIGAPGAGGSNTAGKVGVYMWDDAGGIWSLSGPKMLSPHPDVGEEEEDDGDDVEGEGKNRSRLFGYDVSLNGDGSVLAVASPGTTRNTPYLYQRKEEEWMEHESTFLPSLATSPLIDQTINSVSVSGIGDTLVVGATTGVGGAGGEDLVTVYHLSTTTSNTTGWANLWTTVYMDGIHEDKDNEDGGGVFPKNDGTTAATNREENGNGPAIPVAGAAFAALSGNGSTFAVGGPRSGPDDAGIIQVYDLSIPGDYVHETTTTMISNNNETTILEKNDDTNVTSTATNGTDPVALLSEEEDPDDELNNTSTANATANSNETDPEVLVEEEDPDDELNSTTAANGTTNGTDPELQEEDPDDLNNTSTANGTTPTAQPLPSILGQTDGDHVGASLSMSGDGTILAVGGGTLRPANTDDTKLGGDEIAGVMGMVPINGPITVSQLVFTETGDAGLWEPMMIAMDDAASEDVFGYSIALSPDGRRLAVGIAGLPEEGATDEVPPPSEEMTAGSPELSLLSRVQMFERSSPTSWDPVGGVVIETDASSLFGLSVSLSEDGTWLAVGDPGYMNGLGRVSVYEFTDGEEGDASSWKIMGEPIVSLAVSESDEAEEEMSFGWSVSLSGDGHSLAIGAPHSSEGSASVWDWTTDSDEDASGAWIRFGEVLSGGITSKKFGHDVDLSANGTYVAVGAPESSGEAGEGQGKAFVFVRGLVGEAEDEEDIEDSVRRTLQVAPAGGWEMYGTPLSANLEEGDRGGFSVAISGDGQRVLVGAPGSADDDDATTDGVGETLIDVGFAVLYAMDGDGGGWSPVSLLQDDAGNGGEDGRSSPGDSMGYAVALSSDGETAAVGAPMLGSSGRGYVRAHEVPRDGDGSSLVDNFPLGTTNGTNATNATDVSSDVPSSTPSVEPSITPSVMPSGMPSTSAPTTASPTDVPSTGPSALPSSTPSVSPSSTPSSSPSASPSSAPSASPSMAPTTTQQPSAMPSSSPTSSPSASPSSSPSSMPSPYFSPYSTEGLIVLSNVPRKMDEKETREFEAVTRRFLEASPPPDQEKVGYHVEVSDVIVTSQTLSVEDDVSHVFINSNNRTDLGPNQYFDLLVGIRVAGDVHPHKPPEGFSFPDYVFYGVIENYKGLADALFATGERVFLELDDGFGGSQHVSTKSVDGDSESLWEGLSLGLIIATISSGLAAICGCCGFSYLLCCRRKQDGENDRQKRSRLFGRGSDNNNGPPTGASSATPEETQEWLNTIDQSQQLQTAFDGVDLPDEQQPLHPPDGDYDDPEGQHMPSHTLPVPVPHDEESIEDVDTRSPPRGNRRESVEEEEEIGENDESVEEAGPVNQRTHRRLSGVLAGGFSESDLVDEESVEDPASPSPAPAVPLTEAAAAAGVPRVASTEDVPDNEDPNVQSQQQEKRKAIQAIMKDTTLSPLEKRQEIQKVMDGRNQMEEASPNAGRQGRKESEVCPDDEEEEELSDEEEGNSRERDDRDSVSASDSDSDSDSYSQELSAGGSDHDEEDDGDGEDEDEDDIGDDQQETGRNEKDEEAGNDTGLKSNHDEPPEQRPPQSPSDRKRDILREGSIIYGGSEQAASELSWEGGTVEGTVKSATSQDWDLR